LHTLQGEKKKTTNLQTNHYKDPVATFTNSLYFRVPKNISDYIPPNEKTG